MYLAIGISKQAVSKKLQKMNKVSEERLYLRLIIDEIRHSHPTMGVRDMYYKIAPETMGRDCFEAFCREEDLMIFRKRNERKTTDSNGVIRFENLIENLCPICTNRFWQSDITYYEIDGKFYYLTFIVDGYSRLIVGYSVSRRLFTEQTTLPALEMAIKLRGKIDYSELIFHSDGGGQYYAKSFRALTEELKIKSSMCKYSWENGKAERINGIIKNNYLAHRNIKTYDDLVKEVDRAVYLYNNEKPHIKLKRLTPIAFEKKISSPRQPNERDVLHNSSINGRGIEPQPFIWQPIEHSVLPTVQKEKALQSMQKNNEKNQLKTSKNKSKTVNLI